MPDLREQLQRCFEGRVCLMGLGNVDYGDDGIGVRLAEALVALVPENGDASRAHEVINAGTMPERFVRLVSEKGFDHLIFLDAVEFNEPSGSVVFLNAEAMTERFPQISTHKISLSALAEYIETEGTKTWLLGVQPESLRTAGKLTSAVQATLEALTQLIGECWFAEKLGEPGVARTEEGAPELKPAGVNL
jgi:hydrogenase maturation protease